MLYTDDAFPYVPWAFRFGFCPLYGFKGGFHIRGGIVKIVALADLLKIILLAV